MTVSININSSKLSAILGQNPIQIKIYDSSSKTDSYKPLIIRELCKLYPDHTKLIQECFTQYSVTNVSKNGKLVHKCDVYIL
jgi:hypothetical protein